MVRTLLFLLLLGVSNVSMAQTCYWTGNGYNSTCWACSPNGGLPDWWRQQYCGAPTPTCQARTETKTESCPINYTGAITSTRYTTCANPYQEVIGDWYITSNTCTPICQAESQTQTLSCPIHYTGSITQTKTKTCTTSGQGIWGNWVTTSNTCVQNPPTCQVSSQTQTLSCPTGYTGSITQTRSSTCPNPYGSPVWSAWVTTSDTCKKAATNPTNPVSPVNPASPTSPTSTTSVQTTQSSPATVSTPNTVPSSVATPTDSTTTSTSTSTTSTKTDVPTTTALPTTSTTPTLKDSPSPPKGKAQSVVGLVLSLELFQKPGLTQPNVFPEMSVVKGIPNEILMHDQNLMGLMFQPTINQEFNVPDLGFEQ